MYLVYTFALADKLKEQGQTKIKAITAHPGVASTNLMVTTSQDGALNPSLARFALKQNQSAEDGTIPILMACIDQTVRGVL